jgi:hypothetical protein
LARRSHATHVAPAEGKRKGAPKSKRRNTAPAAAKVLIGAVGKYDVVTVAGTMALRIPKKYLAK